MSASVSTIVQKKRNGFAHALEHAFPTPSLLHPPAAGIDISDVSIKWIVLEGDEADRRIAHFGSLPLHEGIVEKGTVKDVQALALSLHEVKKQLGGIECAHAALPEEAAYVFTMYVPALSTRDEIIRLIEFEFEDHVPMPPGSATYDFNVINEQGGETGTEIAVVAFMRDFAHAYVAAFAASGMALLSLELEARSIARVVSGPFDTKDVDLLVDFGRARTGFAVLKGGIPIFTSTVDVGDDLINKTLEEKFGLTGEAARLFKNEEGLRAPTQKDSPGPDAVVGVASALGDEIVRHFHYWETRRTERGAHVDQIERVILTGGGANLRGLADYIAHRIHVPVIRGDVWRNIFSFEAYIPPIDRRTSLQYAAAVGLALRNV